MKNLSISDKVKDKLATKHQVHPDEVVQAFSNRKGKLLLDTREDVKTDPPTIWFIAKTNKNRILKIVYILKEGVVHLKTAYEPNERELSIFSKFGGED